MKIKNRALLIGLIAVGLLSWSASATTYSDTDFGNISVMASYNGTYVPGSPGYEHLAYPGDPTDPTDVDAVVGVKGPLGTLNSLSMSFTYANLTSSGSDVPFAAFGVSLGSTWNAGDNQFDIISDNGNQLYGYSLVHVWDLTTGADVAGLSGVTLNSILNLANPYSSATYGSLEAMRAYAYVGDEGALSGSVDINSITVGSYVASAPDVASTALLLGLGFSTLVVFGFRQNRVTMAK